MKQPVSPTRHESDIRFANMKLMKQQILDMRQRKQAIPKVPEPSIVISFEQLYEMKSNETKKKILMKRIENKEKEYKKISTELEKYKQKYSQKQKSFKDKQHIPKVLNEKLQKQYEKTKSIFRDVSFNKSITSGVKKLNYYRVAEILFNQSARTVFSAIDNIAQQKDMNIKSQQQVGICIGYLGLLISIVGELSGARMWFDFVFKGSKSLVKLSDNSHVILRPRQARFSQGMNVMVEQLTQIMKQNLHVQVPKTKNLYQICEELSKFLLA